MKLGIRNHGFCSAFLSKSQVNPLIIEISALHTQEKARNKGLATFLINQITKEADKDLKVLMIVADDEKLEHFYSKFGFTKIQNEPILMARKPNGERR